jgi:hypothetical protein
MRVSPIVWLVVALLAAPRLAAAGDPPDFKKAKLHYDLADQAMREGRYDAAASEYAIAYEITQDPILFLKIGNAHEKAGKCPSAVVYWRRYLKEAAPSDEVRATTEEKIASCGQVAATTDPDEPVAPTPDPDPDPAPEPGDASDPGAVGGGGAGPGEPSFLDDDPSWKKSAGWIGIGATIALGTAGTILAMSGASRQEDLESLADFRDPQGRPATYQGTVAQRYDEIAAEGERFNRLAVGVFVAAGVCAAASVALLVVDARGGGSGESASAISRRWVPVLGKDHAGVTARFEF